MLSVVAALLVSQAFVTTDAGMGVRGPSFGAGIGFQNVGAPEILNTSLAVSVYVVGSDNAPSGTLDYPVPHDSYSVVGKRHGDVYGAMLTGGWGVGRGVSLHLGGGLGFRELAVVAQSDATGWYYKQATRPDVLADLYAGLGLALSGDRMSLRAGFSTVRGPVLGIAWQF
jgi:hypothetical protein